jgi:hypothetical protein
MAWFRDAREHPVEAVPTIEGRLQQPGAQRQVEAAHRLHGQAGVARGNACADALAKAVGKTDQRRFVELRARLKLVVANPARAPLPRRPTFPGLKSFWIIALAKPFLPQLIRSGPRRFNAPSRSAIFHGRRRKAQSSSAPCKAKQQ